MALPMTVPAMPFDHDLFALTLQLEELETQRERQTGKWREDSPPDFALAFIDFEAELRKAILLVEDLRLAHSTAQAVDVDAEILEQLTTEESQARQDRSFALRIQDDDSQNPGRGAVVDNSVTIEDSAFVTWEDLELDPEQTKDSVLREDVESICESLSPSLAGPSVPYALRQRQVLQNLPLRKLKCVACRSEFHPHETIRLECKSRHVYCSDCLNHLFLMSITDEFLFPPKCCGTAIPVSLVEGNLSLDESKAFHSAEVEYGTANRLYCAGPACGRFIGSRDVAGDRAHCDACGIETCAHCKKEVHEGDCPEDEVMNDFLTYSAGQRWQRCFKCRAMVERPDGCDHMTCRCNAEFCYRCGVVWKQCACDDWQQDMRERRAQQVVDREAIRPLPAVERRLRVREIEQELERNHECQHHGRWQRLEGSGRRGFTCDFCGDRHWKYILGCRHCHVTACESCRRHRV